MVKAVHARVKLFCGNPLAIATAYFGSVFIAALLFSYIEVRAFGDSLWWAFITSTTIGYGDIFPITFWGRTIAVAFSLFWIFLIIPCVVAHILNKMLENRDAFTHDEQEWQERSLKLIAEKLNVELLPPPPRDW